MYIRVRRRVLLSGGGLIGLPRPSVAASPRPRSAYAAWGRLRSLPARATVEARGPPRRRARRGSARARAALRKGACADVS